MADFSILKNRIDEEINDDVVGGITEQEVNELLKDSINDFDTKKSDAIPVLTSMPNEGLHPNIFYNLGTISQTRHFKLADYVSDGFLKQYMFMFSIEGTPTITWDEKITKWFFGIEPSVVSGKTYLVSVINGFGIIQEYAQGSPAPDPTILEVSPATIAISGTEEKTLTITCDGAWTISAPAWLTPSSVFGFGNAVVTLTPQPTSEYRTGTINVSAGQLSEDVAVTQEAGEYFNWVIGVYPPFPAEGGEKTLTITSNTDWHLYLPPDWLWFDVGGNLMSTIDGNGDAVVTIVADPKTTPGERRGNLQRMDGATILLSKELIQDGTL